MKKQRKYKKINQNRGRPRNQRISQKIPVPRTKWILLQFLLKELRKSPNPRIPVFGRLQTYVFLCFSMIYNKNNSKTYVKSTFRFWNPSKTYVKSTFRFWNLPKTYVKSTFRFWNPSKTYVKSTLAFQNCKHSKRFG